MNRHIKQAHPDDLDEIIPLVRRFSATLLALRTFCVETTSQFDRNAVELPAGAQRRTECALAKTR